MRKFLPISLLVLVFISQVGYYFFYTFERSAAKASMQEAMEESTEQSPMQVIVLEDNVASIRWEEKGKEFYLDGILYDIASTEKVGGKTLMHCMADKKELQLVKDVAKVLASVNEKSTGKESKHNLKFQLNDFVLLAVEKTGNTQSVPSRQYFDFDVAIHSLSPAVDKDPPRV